jgi:hypothetical protein
MEVEVLAQRGEVARSVKLSSFVSLTRLIERESSFKFDRITANEVSPDSECSLKVEPEDDSPEVEQHGAD